MVVVVVELVDEDVRHGLGRAVATIGPRLVLEAEGAILCLAGSSSSGRY